MWLRRGALDRRIAQGADPQGSPELTRRARQLTSPRLRAGVAAGLRRMLDAAEEPRRGLSAAVPLRRGEILAERELILALAADLDSDDELSARGVALAERLLTHGGSPLYVQGPESVRNAVRHTRAALYLA